MAEEVFMFLLNQIERLEEGLPLEGPDEQPTAGGRGALFMHKEAFTHIGAPTSEHGTIQLTNTPATGRVRTFLELEEGKMEEVTEMLVVELVVVCSPMQSFHLMRRLGHNLMEKREVGG